MVLWWQKDAKNWKEIPLKTNEYPNKTGSFPYIKGTTLHITNNNIRTDSIYYNDIQYPVLYHNLMIFSQEKSFRYPTPTRDKDGESCDMLLDKLLQNLYTLLIHS